MGTTTDQGRAGPGLEQPDLLSKTIRRELEPLREELHQIKETLGHHLEFVGHHHDPSGMTPRLNQMLQAIKEACSSPQTALSVSAYIHEPLRDTQDGLILLCLLRTLQSRRESGRIVYERVPELIAFMLRTLDQNERMGMTIPVLRALMAKRFGGAVLDLASDADLLPHLRQSGSVDDQPIFVPRNAIMVYE